jgi:hypothetical protein
MADSPTPSQITSQKPLGARRTSKRQAQPWFNSQILGWARRRCDDVLKRRRISGAFNLGHQPE